MRKSHALPLPVFQSAGFQEKLLDWYGKNRRDLPWRAKKGKKANPYHVWLSEIMLQQTTVPAVIPYFTKFTERWPNIESLAAAKADDVMAAWAGLGYYARARNLLKCARTTANDLGGIFPQEEKELLALAGIGPYTAAAIGAIAFNKPTVVVDGNIERVTARLFAITKPMPQGKADIRKDAARLFENIAEAGRESPRDMPQALMDLGANICTPTKPLCGLCPVRDYCVAHAQGKAESYPVRAPRKQIPTRSGHVYFLISEKGDVVFETRDEKRMLGGMAGLPTTNWDKSDVDDEVRPMLIVRKSKNLIKIGDVRHTFSHFHLHMEVWVGALSAKNGALHQGQHYVSLRNVKELGLPSVFKKVVKIAMTHLSKTHSADSTGVNK